MLPKKFRDIGQISVTEILILVLVVVLIIFILKQV